MKEKFKEWLDEYFDESDFIDDLAEHLEARLEEYDTRGIPDMTVIELIYETDTTEISLHEQLAQALDNEDYELANEIKKQIDNER